MALNILVVDDSAVMRAMVTKTVRMAGVPVGDVYEAGNGREGLDILYDNSIDLALVDINMPVMSGIEMIERMKQDTDLPDVPIVVISTEGSETRIERLLQHGIEFIQKPFSPELISEIILQATGADPSEATA